ncbi:esterase/lipase [Halobacteroides halobius DSM 5150]|uniref:Esterase/lipase n=1 Tax=Halobacteroides halobius (strain ATCC 35273 / DSM 5150 / MD-1) TaxID=748449 RepID=L0K859_HALHC|nr:alpha/beta fold hydrolase [Halobacteroides halobius]AGB40735.1 esterase/lipase [Halobacteroides halobius DSM 5150]
MKYLDQLAKPFFWEAGNKACLIIHGFTGTPAHMRQLGEFLYQKGDYTVSGILLPGHGTSMEDMEESTWRDWLQAAREEYERLDQAYDQVYVMGLSMGGALTLLLAEEYNVDKIIPIAAPIKIFDKKAYLAPILKYFKRFEHWEESEEKDKYDIGYLGMPVKSIQDLLKLMRLAKQDLGQIDSPALIVQSYQDETVKPISAKLIYDGIMSLDKEIMWLERSGHVCTLGPEKDQIHKKILNFLG